MAGAGMAGAGTAGAGTALLTAAVGLAKEVLVMGVFSLPGIGG
jgi:hypothetical protein